MIGERLKEIRKDHGDSQADLAIKLNVSKFTVQSWEQGKSEPSHNMLINLCRLYRVSSNFLLGLTNDDPIFYQRQQQKLDNSNRMILKEFASFLEFRQKKKGTL